MSFVTEADQSESSKSPERCELGVSAPNRTTTIAHLSSLYDAEDDNAWLRWCLRFGVCMSIIKTFSFTHSFTRHFTG